MNLVQNFQTSWTSFSKPSSGVGSTPIIQAHNRTPKLILNHLTGFLAYLEDRGSRFSWCCPKKPVFELLARPSNNRSGQCIPPHGVTKEISFKMSTFITSIWYGLWNQGHFQPVCRLGTPQNPKLGQFILRGTLHLIQYTRMGPSYRGCIPNVKNCIKH